ncbi:apolipoprotein N-acyltransferase [Candidatus Endolissoclinum faulkneri L2]|uniref:Apolipoprotein N-acyltransferase n=1 Tax=Candidatus Endolissoclinum faulkneri L2 TaxID=1193729 RepID=K7Z3C3_9PROT|nr:apolipoprotein N-acyltransferase [Candidatus Endolissoclinum faulkneri]AFX98453.1 apolipoprotein N-acyltransferase [Candidatus Endolissoclinum faulkneri L2]
MRLNIHIAHRNNTRKRYRWTVEVIALFSGAITSLSLAPLHLIPLSFGHAAILVLVAEATSVRLAAWRAWLWAFGYQASGLHWISNAMLINAKDDAWLIPFANIGLPGILALYAAIAGALAKLFFSNGWKLWIGLSAIYSSAEWLRGHALTGFPWNLPSATIDGWLPLLQSASVIGSYGLSLLVLLVTMLPALWMDRTTATQQKILTASITCLLLILIIGWGILRIATIPKLTDPKGAVPGVVIKIVQGNVPQRDKWNPLLKPEHIKRYLRMSKRRRTDNIRALGLTCDYMPTVVVWPETAVAYLMNDTSNLMRELSLSTPHKGNLIFGAPYITKKANKYKLYNRIFALDSQANVVWTFDKTHLVPFGEYIPLSRKLAINRIVQNKLDFTPGIGPLTMNLRSAPPVSLLVCYEAIFPGETVDPKHRPSWLLNLTNDAWFGCWSGPYQHLAISRLRTIEQRLPMIRVANTGVSAVIDAAGRIVTSISVGITASIDTPLPAALPKPMFSKTGDIPFFIMVLSLLLIGNYQRFRTSRRRFIS